MKKILLFILLLVSVSKVYAELESCAPDPNVCVGLSFNYKFCVPGVGIVDKCVENPYGNNTGLPPGSMPVRMRDVPICYKLKGQLLATPLSASGPNNLTTSQTVTDLQKSADTWNCICEHTRKSSCQTEISIEFNHSNPGIFKDPYNQYSASTELKVYPDIFSPPLPSACYIEADDIRIYINNTDHFIFNGKVPIDVNYTNMIVNESIANSNIITQFQSQYPDCKVYNLVDIAKYQLGLILGLGPAGPDCEGVDCNGVKMPKPITSAGTSNELSDEEKCAFQRLYCYVSIYDYEPAHSKIYPNPGNDAVRIEFELEDYCENVTVKIMDVLGRTLLIPIENKPFNSGVHSELINVKGFENGHYYMIIQTTKKSFIKPFIVIR